LTSYLVADIVLFSCAIIAVVNLLLVEGAMVVDEERHRRAEGPNHRRYRHEVMHHKVNPRTRSRAARRRRNRGRTASALRSPPTFHPTAAAATTKGGQGRCWCSAKEVRLGVVTWGRRRRQRVDAGTAAGQRGRRASSTSRSWPAPAVSCGCGDGGGGSTG
jgi:hypothetical protein